MRYIYIITFMVSDRCGLIMTACKCTWKLVTNIVEYRSQQQVTITASSIRSTYRLHIYRNECRTRLFKLPHRSASESRPSQGLPSLALRLERIICVQHPPNDHQLAER